MLLAQAKWNMPTAYAETNFHTQNIKQFAAEVREATDSAVGYKAMSTDAEVQARGAHVVAIATEGTHIDAEEVIKVPRTDWLLQPVLAIIPLQLLAYHIARERGLNVDQPRNLAKTVTVE